MTTGLITPTEGQETQINEILKSAVSGVLKRRLNNDQSQCLVERGDEVKLGAINLLLKIAGADNVVEIVDCFKFMVPRKYCHFSQIGYFASYLLENRYHALPDELTDASMSKVTDQLVPGKTYEVYIVKVVKRMVILDAVRYSGYDGLVKPPLSVGLQGLSLIWQLKKKRFPYGFIYALDKFEGMLTKKTKKGLPMFKKSVKEELVPYFNYNNNGLFIGTQTASRSDGVDYESTCGQFALPEDAYFLVVNEA